jgi:hypothetical protein
MKHPIIQQGIPLIPDGRARTGINRETLEAMDVGDSVEGTYLVIQGLASQAKAMGLRVTTRKVSENTRRIWRI